MKLIIYIYCVMQFMSLSAQEVTKERLKISHDYGKIAGRGLFIFHHYNKSEINKQTIYYYQYTYKTYFSLFINKKSFQLIKINKREKLIKNKDSYLILLDEKNMLNAKNFKVKQLKNYKNKKEPYYFIHPNFLDLSNQEKINVFEKKIKELNQE
jgi:hypothetical protein